jgi:hypothetical protein
MSEEMHNLWKFVEANVLDEGESLELTFQRKEGIGRHTITMNIDSWLNCQSDQWRFERLKKSMQTTIQILNGEL